MEPEAAFFTLFVGGLMGAACTLMIQWYGRRKVKAALKQEGLTPTRQTELLINENAEDRSSGWRSVFRSWSVSQPTAA
jgi:hypothetical protein